MHRVDARDQQLGQVFEPEPAPHQDLRLVPGLTLVGGVREQRRDAVVDAPRRSRREVRVEARQVRQLLAQGVPVGGAVDRAVERPAAAVQLGDEPFDGDEVRAARHVQEAEDEFIGARGPQLARLAYEHFDVTGGESVRHPEHHAQRNVDRGADLREGRTGRGQAVRRHVGDQLQPVRTTRLGSDRVLRVESDHLQDRTVAHGTPFLQ